MAELDYVEIRGRFAIIVGDTVIDVDSNPDVQWCDEGTVRFTPLLTKARVSSSPDGPFRVGHEIVEAVIGVDGRVTYAGNPFVRLVDLGSAQLDPRVPRGQPAYRVDFLDVRSQGLDVKIPTFSFHPLPNEVNDLTLLAPLPNRLW